MESGPRYTEREIALFAMAGKAVTHMLLELRRNGDITGALRSDHDALYADLVSRIEAWDSANPVKSET